jgi:hypothetical protein
MTGRRPIVTALLLGFAGFLPSVDAQAARVTLQGRVVNSWSCAGQNDSSCAGVPGVSVLVFAKSTPPDAVNPKDCSPQQPVLARTVTGKDGQFVIKTLKKNEEVRSVYCMLGYMPAPTPPQEHKLAGDVGPLVVQIFREVQDDADAKLAATWIAQRVEAQKGKSRSPAELYAQEFDAIATVGLPLESRVLIARAVEKDTNALAQVPRLKEYAALDPQALASLRTSIKSAVDAGGSPERVLSAKTKVSTSIMSEVFLDEYRKRGSEKSDFAWQSLGKDLGLTVKKRTPTNRDGLPDYDVVGPGTFPKVIK